MPASAPPTVGVPLNLDREGPPSLIVVGRTGAGKSTLVNTLFGRNVAETGTRSDVTTGVAKYVLPRTGVAIYDTPGAAGFNESAEDSMRRFLQLEVPPADRRPIDADVVVFVFTYERITRLDFDFFTEVAGVYGPRLIPVKNYRSGETERDFRSNLELIEARTGRRPIAVNAMSAEGIGDLIGEAFRLLPVKRVLAFNRSLESNRQRARDLSVNFARKFAALGVVARGSQEADVAVRLTGLRDQMVGAIAAAYYDDLRLQVVPGASVPRVLETFSEEASGRAVAGGLIAGAIGFLIDPILGFLMLLFGGALGAGSAPKKIRGGSAALSDFVAYARVTSDLLGQAMAEPEVMLTMDAERVKRWLDPRRDEFSAKLEHYRKVVDLSIKRQSLGEFLDHPNTRDPSEVESRIGPVVLTLFSLA
jgi:energy-coupling factor transporter ATP-binding protein EcfA2